MSLTGTRRDVRDHAMTFAVMVSFGLPTLAFRYARVPSCSRCGHDCPNCPMFKEPTSRQRPRGPISVLFGVWPYAGGRRAFKLGSAETWSRWFPGGPVPSAERSGERASRVSMSRTSGMRRLLKTDSGSLRRVGRHAAASRSLGARFPRSGHMELSSGILMAGRCCELKPSSPAGGRTVGRTCPDLSSFSSSASFRKAGRAFA